MLPLIFLLDVLSKILSSMNNHLENHDLKDQAFHENLCLRRCNLDTQDYPTYRTYKPPIKILSTYVLFVDIVLKTFNSVNRERLRKILEKYGIPKDTFIVIKKMYTDIKIKLGIDKAEVMFNSTSGVKQGDNLAPALFLFAIQATIETMHRKWSSMNLSEPQLQFFPNLADGYF